MTGSAQLTAPAAPGATSSRARAWGAAWLAGLPAIAQLVLDLWLSIPYLLLVFFAVLGVGLTPLMLVGAPFLIGALVCARALSPIERGRLAALTGVHVPPAPPPSRERPAWQRVVMDPRPWRALLHLTAISLWGVLAGTATLVAASVGLAFTAIWFYVPLVPDSGLHLPFDGTLDGFGWYPLVFALGVVMLALLPPAARLLVMVDVWLAGRLLGPGTDQEVAELSERVQTLTRTREATVDSVEMERRRIERDLHDGPQQRLVAIAMDLGMAQERMKRDPEGARQLLDSAHTASKEAITEMRMVARGIHPPVLTDRGLDAAFSALAARSSVPVDVSVDLPERPTPTLEAIAYFSVSEALTNVAKHSRATSVRVRARHAEDSLVVEVTDDGIGGADPSRGTGLNGLTSRVAAVDGRLDVLSPDGGPTVLTVRLPWSRS